MEIASSTIDNWHHIFWSFSHGFSLRVVKMMPNLYPIWKLYLESLPYLLPCPACTAHVSAEIKDLSTFSANAFEQSVELHNRVSKRLGKPIVTVQEAENLWIRF